LLEKWICLATEQISREIAAAQLRDILVSSRRYSSAVASLFSYVTVYKVAWAQYFDAAIASDFQQQLVAADHAIRAGRDGTGDKLVVVGIFADPFAERRRIAKFGMYRQVLQNWLQIDSRMLGRQFGANASILLKNL
jgi:hypothetical protein